MATKDLRLQGMGDSSGCPRRSGGWAGEPVGSPRRTTAAGRRSMTDGRTWDSASSPDRPIPLRNDGVTIARAICPVCGSAFHPSGRRRYCSDACRQAAWRHRHSSPATSGTSAQARLSSRSDPWPALPEGASRPARSTTVYECPSCGARYLGEQRCPDCRCFCRRVGPGGRCPHCDEPVAIADLVADEGR